MDYAHFQKEVNIANGRAACQWICPTCMLLGAEDEQSAWRRPTWVWRWRNEKQPFWDRFASSKYGLKLGLLGVNRPRFVESSECGQKSVHRGV